MPPKKITGIAEIDMIASSIAKKFGKENVMSLGPRYEKVKVTVRDKNPWKVFCSNFMSFYPMELIFIG